MNKQRFVIGDVKDVDTGKRSIQFGYRVGRACQIDMDSVIPGVPLIVEYPERQAYFRTSLVKEVIQDQDTVWVTTYKRQYIFHKE